MLDEKPIRSRRRQSVYVTAGTRGPHMRLAELVIHNFRSIRDLRCILGRMTTFLGPNNHGKSNVLAAVEFLLSPGMKIVGDDFCSARPEGDDRLFVEATFVDLTAQEKTTFK